MANRKIAELMNLGERAAEHLATIGIYTEEDLERVGVVEAYLQLKAVGFQQWTVLGVWSMWGALHDMHWNHIPSHVKEALRKAITPTEAPMPKPSKAKRGTKA
ncbi:MAG: hypothetical protein OHK0023_11490 [Anaerolineae bacterium]